MINERQRKKQYLVRDKPKKIMKNCDMQSHGWPPYSTVNNFFFFYPRGKMEVLN